MIDMFEEIFSSIKKNKLRTFLTGFSVGWGIFMLIILLGAGNGISNGMSSNFNFMSTNSMSIFPGYTSEAYGGLQKNRSIRLKDEDSEFISDIFPSSVTKISPVINLWGSRISTNKDYVEEELQGIYPDFKYIKQLELFEGLGRMVNEQDIIQKRKVLMMHQKTAKKLFKDISQIGTYVRVNDIPFQIVGIYDSETHNQSEPIYIPFTTMESIFKPSGYLNSIVFELDGVNSIEEADDFKKQLKSNLGRKHKFSETDSNALWIWDRLSDFMTNRGIMNGIALFIWIIGIGTLIGGVVGISNIMLITVKERTKEFGIRKAIGATPMSIIRLVLTESLFITITFGYIGMLFGVGLLELIAKAMGGAEQGEKAEDSVTVFKDPSVDINIVIAATIVLVIAGIIAGDRKSVV